MYHFTNSVFQHLMPTPLLRFSLTCSNSASYYLFSLQRRYLATKKKLPFNTLINFVPQQEAWVVERFGKFLKVKINFLFQHILVHNNLHIFYF